MLRCPNLRPITFGDGSAITDIDLWHTKIAVLDLSHLAALKAINITYPIWDDQGGIAIYEQAITAVKLGRQEDLDTVRITGSAINEIDLARCPDLRTLDLSRNGRLLELDVSENPELLRLNCGLTAINSVDLSQSAALTELLVYGTKIDSLNVSSCRSLERLDVSKTALKELDLSRCRKLEWLRLDKAPRRKLKLDKNPTLKQRGAINLV